MGLIIKENKPVVITGPIKIHVMTTSFDFLKDFGENRK